VIPGTSGTTGTTGTASTSSQTQSAVNPGGDFGQEQFLQLLVAQLKNQDPLNPMQPDQFAAQLAQFSSVEQLVEANQHLSDDADYSQALAQAMNSSAAVGAIGRSVVAVGDQVQIPASGTGAVTVDIAGNGGAGKLTLTDADGKEVATLDLGRLTSGRQTINLDGLPSDLPPGAYHYKLDVTDDAGDPVGITQYVTGTVDGVHYGTNGPELVIGLLEVPLGSVLQVSADS